MELSDYQDQFSTAEVSRSPSGVLTIRMHTDQGPLSWGPADPHPHSELPELFAAIASDRENKVVVLTGTGDVFIDWPVEPGTGSLVDGTVTPQAWDQIVWEGKRLIEHHLAIEVPMIAAVNGPALAHSELAVLCDIVLASENAVFRDAPHFAHGLVPGDGMQIIWPMLLGPNRGRYFLLTGEEISVTEAHQLGVVSEVLPGEELLERAHALAEDLAKRDSILLRNTREALTRPLKRAMAEDLAFGLGLEAQASLSIQPK